MQILGFAGAVVLPLDHCECETVPNLPPLPEPMNDTLMQQKRNAAEVKENPTTEESKPQHLPPAPVLTDEKGKPQTQGNKERDARKKRIRKTKTTQRGICPRTPHRRYSTENKRNRQRRQTNTRCPRPRPERSWTASRRSRRQQYHLHSRSRLASGDGRIRPSDE